MRSLRLGALALTCAALAACGSTPPQRAVEPGASATAAANTRLSLSNKWRLECSGNAESAGEIVLRVTPKDGSAIDVTAVIRDGRGENGVARDIRDALRASLDPKLFHVEVDDGEDELIKKRKGPNFEVRLVSSSVRGVRINFDKE